MSMGEFFSTHWLEGRVRPEPVWIGWRRKRFECLPEFEPQFFVFPALNIITISNELSQLKFYEDVS